MSRHRDFDAARAENVREPLTFRLAGRDFTIERVPAGPLLDLASNSDLRDTDALAAFGRFLIALVVPEQRDAMREALDDTDLPMLLELVRWVVEEATGSPLSEPSVSPDGPSSTGETPRVVSLSPVKETRSA
jgi:hypothetical protein